MRKNWAEGLSYTTDVYVRIGNLQDRQTVQVHELSVTPAGKGHWSTTNSDFETNSCHTEVPGFPW
jgi:hypothetical protein